MERRHFLLSSAALAGNSFAAPRSPNDTIRIACVGIRGQGRAHIGQYAKMQNVEIAALCDVDDNVLRQRLGDLDKMGKRKPETYTDIRKLLENKDIDAVSIATPNHHHTLQTIWSLQAGKHVYCEKPCSYNMYESKQIVAAAKKYGKLVQHGSNSRSGVAIREAMQHMKDGLLGEVYMTRGLCFKWRDTIGKKPVEAVPAGVNYDLWLGAAKKREFTQNRFHYNWHWNWDYGNGDLGNQGIHEVDICRWGLGVKYPTKVSAIGGHFMFDDDQETPNTLTATYEFDADGKKKMMVFEVRHWMSNHEATIGEKAEFGEGNTVGNVFYGSKGYLAISGYDRYSTFLGKKAEPGPSRQAPGNNWQNFIDAVRADKHEVLNAPIEEGSISCTLVHLANISYRLGRTLHFDAASWSCKGDKEATAMFTRPEGYRKPFVVPEKV